MSLGLKRDVCAECICLSSLPIHKYTQKCIYLRAIIYIVIEAVRLAKITREGIEWKEKMLRTRPQGTPIFMRWAESEISRKDSSKKLPLRKEERESEVERGQKLEKEKVSRRRTRLVVLHAPKKSSDIRSPLSHLTCPTIFWVPLYFLTQ